MTESSVALPPEQERGHAAPPIIHISERRSYREAAQRDRVRLHKGSQHRGRSPQPLPEVRLQAKGRSLNLELPQRWMKEHPLTLEDLEQERAYLKEAGFRLNLNHTASETAAKAQ